MSELSGLELRKAVAELIGWTALHFVSIANGAPGERALWGHTPDHDPAVERGWVRVPLYELSLDACFQDVVPWILRNDVLIEFRMVTPDKMKVFITRLKPSIELAARGYGTPAEAICRAVLKLSLGE